MKSKRNRYNAFIIVCMIDKINMYILKYFVNCSLHTDSDACINCQPFHLALGRLASRHSRHVVSRISNNLGSDLSDHQVRDLTN